MEKEIELINAIIANAIIHGGDWGGPYEINIENLVISINNWLREKGLWEKYHVVESGYRQTLSSEYKYLKDRNGDFKTTERTRNFSVVRIVPIGERSDLKYTEWDNLDCIP